MEKIRVDLGEHSYDICIGSGLLRAGNSASGKDPG